ncbi:MAG: hypothetical protein QF681_03735 [Vicinamibacterales bacterium]|jgi:hypothetical protein|nr:hypothetical protein [Vicinamibacterales bacterium]
MSRTALALALVTVASLAAAPAVAQDASSLAVGDADGFMGKWTLSMVTDQGEFAMGLDLTDVGGMVSGLISNDYMGNETVTDITKSGDNLVLKYDANMQGQGIAVEVTLEPAGEGLDVAFDFGGQFFMDGKGTR